MTRFLFPMLVCTCLVLLSCGGNHQHSESSEQPKDTVVSDPAPETGYDSALAASYGADAYGMKKYVFAFLKRGPNRDLDSAKAMELQLAHLNNIDRMAQEGKLVLAGPFFGNDDLRGVYIFNVESIEEAEALTNTDPAIQSGSLVMELREWYGSAGLMGLNELHNRLQKANVTENFE